MVCVRTEALRCGLNEGRGHCSLCAKLVARAVPFMHTRDLIKNHFLLYQRTSAQMPRSRTRLEHVAPHLEAPRAGRAHSAAPSAARAAEEEDVALAGSACGVRRARGEGIRARTHLSCTSRSTPTRSTSPGDAGCRPPERQGVHDDALQCDERAKSRECEAIAAGRSSLVPPATPPPPALAALRPDGA